MDNRLVMTIFLSTPLFGCAWLPGNDQNSNAYSGINPPKIHVNLPEYERQPPIKDVVNKVSDAELSPFVAYYKALEEARESDAAAQRENRYNPLRRTEEQKTKLVEFATKGIALVNASCTRWFQSLMEAQIKLDYQSANRNVIKDLGTTLLGLGNANQYFVGTYGAVNTAASGLEKNFSQAFLLAPNANKLKSHVFMALDKQAIEIKKNANATRATFADVYDDLERYADLCTQHTAREIMNTALDQTKTEVSGSEGGKIKTTPTVSAADIEKAQFTSAVEEIKQFKTAAETQLREQNAALAATQTKNAQLEKNIKTLADENSGLKEIAKALQEELRSIKANR
jgi:hypothetical protein